MTAQELATFQAILEHVEGLLEDGDIFGTTRIDQLTRAWVAGKEDLFWTIQMGGTPDEVKLSQRQLLALAAKVIRELDTELVDVAGEERSKYFRSQSMLGVAKGGSGAYLLDVEADLEYRHLKLQVLGEDRTGSKIPSDVTADPQQIVLSLPEVDVLIGRLQELVRRGYEMTHEIGLAIGRGAPDVAAETGMPYAAWPFQAALDRVLEAGLERIDQLTDEELEDLAGEERELRYEARVTIRVPVSGDQDERAATAAAHDVLHRVMLSLESYPLEREDEDMGVVIDPPMLMSFDWAREAGARYGSEIPTYETREVVVDTAGHDERPETIVTVELVADWCVRMDEDERSEIEIALADAAARVMERYFPYTGARLQGNGEDHDVWIRTTYGDGFTTRTVIL